MKAISIQQPWAWAILFGGKDIENRNWTTNVRGRVLIHAGKKIDLIGIETLKNIYGINPELMIFETGGVVGSVEITDCAKSSSSKWFTGKFGFVLRNPMVLPFMPYRGQRGFFEVNYQKPGVARCAVVRLR